MMLQSNRMRHNLPTIKGFLSAFGANWFTKMSGPLTVPFTLAALFVPSTWLKALFAALAILCGAAASYAVWAAERRNANALELRLAPKLCIPKRIHKQPWTDTRGKCVSYYIDVINESEAATVEGIEISLTEINPPEIDWLPVPLHIKHDNTEPHKKEFSLNPLGKRQIDVISSVQGAPDIRIESPIGGTGVTVPAGRYTMTITASGRDVKPTETMFDVWVDHTGYLQAKAIK